MSEDVLALTAQIVSAHVTKNPVDVADLSALIRDVFRTLSGLSEPAPAPVVEAAKPAVPAARSVFATHIICMECGKKMTMLKRHLMTEHGLTIDQYRAKHNLPGTYPMVAPDYAKTRSSLAKEMGLGKSRAAAPKKAGRRK
jgi:predicted transcriptional regulator